MYLIVSWDIPDGPEWNELNQQMVSCFAGRDWSKPLSTFYMVRFSGSYEELSSINDALLQIALKGNIKFVLAPVFGDVGCWGYFSEGQHSEVQSVTRLG